jgi:hypothetical protein
MLKTCPKLLSEEQLKTEKGAETYPTQEGMDHLVTCCLQTRYQELSQFLVSEVTGYYKVKCLVTCLFTRLA